MDEATREGRPAVAAAETDEQKSPEEIRREIDQTREELGETVEALAHKTDVKAQARERGRLDQADRAAEARGVRVQGPLGDAESAQGGAQSVVDTAKSNPLPFAVGGALLAGFVIGRISSR